MADEDLIRNISSHTIGNAVDLDNSVNVQLTRQTISKTSGAATDQVSHNLSIVFPARLRPQVIRHLSPISLRICCPRFEERETPSLYKHQGLLLFLVFIGASSAHAADEHCLVVQAMAIAGYEARMDLLMGTDDIFTAAYYEMKKATNAVHEKYTAQLKARNRKGSDENPENHGASFGSPAERFEYFNKWNTDIKALEAAESSESAVYSEVFANTMKSDPNIATRRRLARIDALWKKEMNAPCYWGAPK